MASLLAKPKLILPLLLLLGIASEPLKAEKEFDYFTLALSWSGTKCLNVDSGQITVMGLGLPAVMIDFQLLKTDLEWDWPSYNCTLSSACGSPKGSNWAYEVPKPEYCSNCL
nr:ribonuclease 2-like [Ipomoea batatas]